MFPHCPRPGPLQECGHTAHNHLAWGMQRVVWTVSFVTGGTTRHTFQLWSCPCSLAQRTLPVLSLGT